jgi:hypothetical protein
VLKQPVASVRASATREETIARLVVLKAAHVRLEVDARDYIRELEVLNSAPARLRARCANRR